MPTAELGLSSADHRVARLAVGFVAGSALTMLWLGIVTVMTGATWHLNPAFRGVTLVTACAFNFFNNVGEELAYRGYAFVKVADRFGAYIAVVATSSIFALLHLQGGVPWLSVLAGVFTSGLVFGAIFARWRSVPLALGFHVATNIVQDFSGLRASAASVFAPTYPATATGAGGRILIGIALINLVVAVGILTLRTNARPARGLTNPAADEHFSDATGRQ
jgi:membrane protease YdiL (CAAX protease family)